ncbi:MAG: DUF4411 family protein [Patescibacteria group bacterium]
MNIDGSKPIYVVDANVLFGFATWNPLEFRPEFWEKFEKALKDKKWVLLDVVVGEVIYDGELKRWCKKQKDRNLVTRIDDAIRNLAIEINNKYPMINVETGNSSVDPFLIAFASKNDLGVFTREIHKTPGEHLYKIPDVCEALKIACIKNPTRFMKSIGFK